MTKVEVEVPVIQGSDDQSSFEEHTQLFFIEEQVRGWMLDHHPSGLRQNWKLLIINHHITFIFLVDAAPHRVISQEEEKMMYLKAAAAALITISATTA